jgi:hypothetical protein
MRAGTGVTCCPHANVLGTATSGQPGDASATTGGRYAFLRIVHACPDSNRLGNDREVVLPSNPVFFMLGMWVLPPFFFNACRKTRPV